MKTLILMLVIYLIISRLRAKSLPGQTPGGEPGGYSTSSGRDRPMPGPWNLPAPDEDAPLPGPWNRPPGEPGAGEMATTPNPAPEPETEMDLPADLPERRPQRGPEMKPERPAATPRREGCAGETTAPVPRTCSPEDTSMTKPRRHRRRVKNPLAAALDNRCTVAGSLILGEVLGSRGGRGGNPFPNRRWR